MGRPRRGGVLLVFIVGVVAYALFSTSHVLFSPSLQTIQRADRSSDERQLPPRGLSFIDSLPAPAGWNYRDTSSPPSEEQDYKELFLSSKNEVATLRAHLARETSRADALAVALRREQEGSEKFSFLPPLPSERRSGVANAGVGSPPSSPISTLLQSAKQLVMSDAPASTALRGAGSEAREPTTTAPAIASNPPTAALASTPKQEAQVASGKDGADADLTNWPNLGKTGGFVTQTTIDELTTFQRTGHNTGAENVEEAEKKRMSDDADHQEHPCGLLPSELASHPPHEGETTCELASRLGPHLALRRNWRVCLLPKSGSGGVRAFALIEQGLKLHPDVTNVPMKDIRSADFVVWMPGSTKIPPKPEDCPPHRLIVVDFGDGFQPLPIARDPLAYGMYFKRSWVVRRYDSKNSKRAVSTPSYAKKRAYFPISYSIAEEFLMASSKEAKQNELKPPPGVVLKTHKNSTFSTDASQTDPTGKAWPPVAFPNPTANVFYGFARDRSVVCTLRPAGRGSMDVRRAVLYWVADAAKEWGLKRFIAGEVDHGGRRVIQNANYLDTMRQSRVVVTSNPTGWEGDSRTWEALASGALVMVDTMVVPLPFPLVDKVHVVYYDPMDKAAFLEKLRYYLSHPDEARRIGLQGHAYAVRHHRTANRADYMLSVAQFHKDGIWKRKPRGRAENNSNTRRRRLLMVQSQAEAAGQFALSAE